MTELPIAQEELIGRRCSYHEGMFFHASDGADAVCYHEAGHAVAGYALGLGCVRITVTTTYVADGWRQGGMVFYPKRMRQAYATVGRRLRATAPTPADLRILVAVGIRAAAGMAAEREYARLWCIPVKPAAALAGGTVSDSDHEFIDGVDKMLSCFHQRQPFAFQRLVWARAQAAMEHPSIWGAVEEIGEAFGQGLVDEEHEDDEATGDTIASVQVMSGQRARAIMRRHGVFPGIARGKHGL